MLDIIRVCFISDLLLTMSCSIFMLYQSVAHVVVEVSSYFPYYFS